ncbi:MAG: hypothetical protein QOI63_2019 [Thermoplasmata archaeon]|jgi:hypothetical protein|nr:hypothetical protein [Thermoplasmata archaeon]
MKLTSNGLKAAVVGALLLGLAGISTSSGANGPSLEGLGLPAKFTGGELQAMDPARVRADAADGSLTLTLLGRSYELSLSPAPWDVDVGLAVPQADGSFQVTAPSFHNAAFVGRVAGEADSLATVLTVAEGVDGFVRVGAGTVYFEPMAFTSLGAPAGVSVVYRPDDVASPMLDFSNDEDVVETVEGVAPLPLPSLDEASHIPGPNRDLMLWIDSAFWSLHGGISKAVSTFNQVNAFYSSSVGFTFNLVSNAVYICTDGTCDTTWGMTSTDAATLRNQWSDKVHNSCACPSFELAHLLSGKNLDGGTIGISYLPGRYAISQVRDESVYDGGSSDYESGLLMAHEVGHNFNGRHDRATSSTHYHPRTVCDLLVPVVNICLQSHTVYDAYTHYTTMWTPYSHEPSSYQEMPGTFSSTNYDYMRTCNSDDWTEGTFATVSNPTMGYWCNN